LEGQWAGAEGDWQIAARRSTLDLLAHAFEPDLGKPKLTDVFTSAHWPVRPGWLASVGLLSALDETAVAETDGSESSQTDAHRLQGWLGLDGRIGAISLQTRIAFNSSDTNRIGQISDEDGAKGTLLDQRSVKSVLLLQDALLPLGDAVLRFGWQAGRSDVAYDYRKAVTFTEKATTLYGVPEEQNFVIDADTAADEQAAYIAAQWSPAAQLTADVGLRGERRKYDSGQQAARLDPRLSLLYRSARRMAWRLSWGTFTQLASAAELPVDRELSRFDRPERSSLWVLGWDYAFGPQRTLRLELYDRRTRHPWPHLESLIDPLVLVPELRPDQVLVAPRDGHSWGADLYWSGWLSDRWRGWMSYSYSHAVDAFDSGHVSRSWDQRHAFVAALTTDRLGWGWTAMLTAHSGWPTTPITVIDDELVLGRRNAARLGGYVTLDLKAQREVRMQRGTLRLTAELTNATDRRNPCCSSFEFGGDGEPPVIDQHQWLPLLPLLSMSWQF